MILLTGTSNAALAREVAERVGTPLAARVMERFPDGELHTELRESVRGQKVFLLQSTSPPVEPHLFELLFLADACRRAGARQRIAVMPYFGYARQDRRAVGREPIGARVVADILVTSGIDAVVVLDLHSQAVEGFFSVPAEHLSAVPLLADALRASVGESTVLVAPDLGAVKLTDRYGRLLRLPVATIHKIRLSGQDVKVQQIVGDVRGRAPIIIDDMISTGGTVAAATRALLSAGCLPDVTVAVTHGLFSDRASDTLRDLPITRLLTTDTVAPRDDLSLPVRVVSVAQLLADVIKRLDQETSLGSLGSRR